MGNYEDGRDNLISAMHYPNTIGVLLVMLFHSLLIFNTNPESIMYIKDTVNFIPI